MNLLKLSALRKVFGGLVAVNDIDLVVEQGEIRGLIGPNGSGKTTLLNLISGFLRPTYGKVIWKGQDITGLPEHIVVAKGIARTFQLTTLFRDMTALRNVVISCYFHSRWNLLQAIFGPAAVSKEEKAVEEKALGLLDFMGIAHVKDEIAGKLPHGYQRLLGIAIALATNPELLLLDEPVTGLNPVETQETMARVRKIRDRGITILLVEHNMKAIMSNCEKITVMNFGKKIGEGSPEEVSKDKNVIEAYLGGEEVYA